MTLKEVVPVPVNACQIIARSSQVLRWLLGGEVTRHLAGLGALGASAEGERQQRTRESRPTYFITFPVFSKRKRRREKSPSSFSRAHNK